MDETGRLAGRGAYLCADGSCWRQAVEKGTLQRALDVPLPEALKVRLRAGGHEPAEGDGERPGGPGPVRAGSVHATIDEMNEGEALGQE
jgi:hypothetical protein